MTLVESESDLLKCSADLSIANLVGMAKEADARNCVQEALALLKRALHIAQDAHGDESLSVATIAWEMSGLLEKAGRTEEASESYSVVRRILGIYKRNRHRMFQFN